MNGVVLVAHDWFDVTIHGVVDVGSPNRGGEHHNEVCKVVTGDKEEPKHVR